MVKLNINITFALLLFGLLFAITSCDNNDDEPTVGSANITLASNYEGARGTTVTIPLNLSTTANIQSLTVSVDGGSASTLNTPTGANTASVNYDYPIPGDAILGATYNLEFNLTDSEGNVNTANTTITVAPVLATTPSAYEFTRNGATTVSFSGQTDRLNMVAEIKSKVLAEADAGNPISEQVLLDAYLNTNNNGGGLFSFESDRKISNKVFQPDADDQLFETFFKQTAEASIAGNQGVMASSGTAGLIVRENSGKTILLDANGREFTQLIEKGLMGSLMYNQIYNVYLTEDRIGNNVENTELRSGTNYTDMEHHWDEAFGYFESPVDFSSPWPDARELELRFWANYSNVVDNVLDGQLGTNKIVMDAFIAGRAAIVNNDPTTRDAQRDILYENLDLVAAATTVHYINSTLGHLNAGDIGEAFHTLSEAWAFTNALRYNPNRILSLSELETIMNTDYGQNGNFWNVTPESLNTAKTKLVNAYPKLDPVKDNL